MVLEKTVIRLVECVLSNNLTVTQKSAIINGSQLAKMKKYIPYISLP